MQMTEPQAISVLVDVVTRRKPHDRQTIRAAVEVAEKGPKKSAGKKVKK